MTYIGHSMLYQDKTTTATEELLIPSPQYEYIVHVFDTVGHMAALPDC